MKNTVIAAMAVALLSSQGLAFAKGPQLVPGSEAQQRVSQLTREMPWFHSLGQAEAAAQKQQKMIFWVQMLGDMGGAT